MSDRILKPLDPIYARNAPLCEKDPKKKRKVLERNIKYNAERRKRIAKCWDCGYFSYCFDPGHCRKENGEQEKGDNNE